MKSLRRTLLNEDVPAQALRLKRVLLGVISYLFTLTLVFVFWHLDLIEGKVVARYAVLIGVVNVGFYLIIRSGWNLRFSEPSLTLLQICVSLPTGVYVMYYVKDARSMLLLLSVSAAMYGLFQFRTRDFIIMTATLLGTYLVLIIALVAMKPSEIRLQIEIVQLIVLGAAMLQFSALGSYISRLRFNVKDKNQELGKRNIELEQALQRNHELAIRDELTGVFNRRYLMEIIRTEKSRCDRNGRVFSICILDVDFFKNVNDTYGHLAGDEVLRAIARTASDALRQTDYFGRYGGEEFALVLTDTLADGALVTAERVRTRIEELTFPDINPELKITVSIGIAACLPGEETSLTFKRADDALYRAKHEGRNRSITAAAVKVAA